MVEERIQPEELPEKLEADPDRDLMTRATVDALIDSIVFDRHPEQVLAGLAALLGDRLAPETARVREVWNQHDQASREAASTSTGLALAELAARGITGSALRGKGDTDGAAETGAADNLAGLEKGLEEVKAQMKIKAG